MRTRMRKRSILRKGRRTLGGLQVFRVPGENKKLKFINLFSICLRACESARPVWRLGADFRHRQTIGGFQVFTSSSGKEKTEI